MTDSLGRDSARSDSPHQRNREIEPFTQQKRKAWVWVYGFGHQSFNRGSARRTTLGDTQCRSWRNLPVHVAGADLRRIVVFKPVASNLSFLSGRTKWWDSPPKLRGSIRAFDSPVGLLQHSKKVPALAASHFYFGEVFRFGLVNIPWPKRSWID
jgi:hypothetical protein